MTGKIQQTTSVPIPAQSRDPHPAFPLASYREAAFQAQSADINLVTHEGDRVTLVQASQVSRAQAAFHGQFPCGMEPIDLSGMQGCAMGGMEILVSGELSEEELADIGRLVQDLTNIAEDFFAGEKEKAMLAALSLGDLRSVSEVRATFSRTTALYREAAVHGPGPSAPDLLANREASEFDPLDLDQILYEQWKNFVATILTPENEGRPTPDRDTPSDVKPQAPARQLLERILETVARYPGFAPYMKPMGEHAVDRALAQADDPRGLPPLAGRIKHEFRQEYQRWLNA